LAHPSIEQAQDLDRGFVYPAATRTTQPAQPHQSLDCAARHGRAFTPPLTPDLVWRRGPAQIPVVHPLHLAQQLSIALGSLGKQRGVAPVRCPVHASLR
jgi:hypothetical protein